MAGFWKVQGLSLLNKWDLHSSNAGPVGSHRAVFVTLSRQVFALYIFCAMIGRCFWNIGMMGQQFGGDETRKI